MTPAKPCPTCGSIEPELAERQVEKPRAARGGRPAKETFAPPPAPLQPLADVSVRSSARMSTGIAEFDRVLGGGLVEGSLVLIAGEPGSGKSSLLLSAAASIARAGESVIYISAEESAGQIRLRAERFGLEVAGISVMGEAELSNISDTLDDQRPALAIIDSINAIYDSGRDGIAGSPNQVRECASALMRLAKDATARRPLTIVMIGHVTKDNNIAGPKTLEHMVDATLLLSGDKHGFFRLLRAAKNRYGATNEVGLFEMRDDGLASVEDPSSVLIAHEGLTRSGRVLCPVIEGARPLLVEVQALCVDSAYSQPRRVADGIDYNRLQMLLAVLDKYCGVKLLDQDVYVSVSAGIEVEEPAIDAAILVAVASSEQDRALAERLAVLGEVGLGGEVRSVSGLEMRARESRRQGIERLIGPAGRGDESIERVADVRQLLRAAGLRVESKNQ